MITLGEIRECFPALEASTDVLLDNAGGSQVPRPVAEAVRDYMLGSYVQLGADYETSRRCTATVDEAHSFLDLFMNGAGRGHVVLASSTTVLCDMLARCYAAADNAGRNEIIIAETAHEANAGPWYRMADAGFHVTTWPIEGAGAEIRLDSLRRLLSPRTRMVAFPHVSNILGRIEDARAITDAAHDAGARVVVDGVAYAPHRAIDVTDLGADWYTYSTYKVFGPHMAAMFGTADAFAELEGPNHFFIPPTELPYKFEPGGPSHEGCAGILALWNYLARLAGVPADITPERSAIEAAYQHVTRLESALQARLIDYLRTRKDLRIIGPDTADPARVATISFVHRHKTSQQIARAANERGYGIRFGHFYAYRLCRRLAQQGLLHDVEDGVVRVSMLHYNSPEEIEGLIQCLDDVM